MDMSLEEYIASKKCNSSKNRDDSCSNLRFVDEGRSVCNYEDISELNDSDEDILNLEEHEVDDGNDSLGLVQDMNCVSNPSTDLRQKITGSAVINMPNSNSQQWRLMYPNVCAKRPAGMPPLVSLDAPKESFTTSQRGKGRQSVTENTRKECVSSTKGRSTRPSLPANSRKETATQRRRRRRRLRPKSAEDIVYVTRDVAKSSHNNRNSLKSLNKFEYESTFRSAFEQQFNPRNDRNILNNQQSFLKNQQHYSDTTNEMKNMIINVPSSSIGTDAERNSKESGSGQFANAFNNVSGNQSISSLFNINHEVTAENMPLLASTFLNFFQNPMLLAEHKPRYDMNIQRSLHELQGKPLIYTSPGGRVVSSDGVGISDCKPTPRTTNITMNCRFT